jgi:glucose/arabinose dehydrogenase
MDRRRTRFPVLVLIAAAMPHAASAQPSGDPAAFVVREGFKVEKLADVRGARFLQFDDRGMLYVSRQTAEITTFRYTSGKLTELGQFVGDRPSVHGLDFQPTPDGGWLWFSTTSAIFKGRDTNADGKADEIVEVVKDLPGGGGHWWRSILVGNDALYTGVGDTGNITDETATDRQKIWKFNLDGSGKKLWASGIRNTEKIRFRPGLPEGVEQIWGFDHGSDWFGRESGDTEKSMPITNLNPPDELNIYVEGGFYGHPFLVGNRIPRPEHATRRDLQELARKTIPPAWAMPAHWAANAFTFVDPAVNAATGALPPDFSGDIIVACRGSWNSAVPVGYCIARIDFDADPNLGGGPSGIQKLVSTIDSDQMVHARPVDATQAPDGSILFTSDTPGAIYRLTWTALAPKPAESPSR